jgi:hypothetical protein
MVKVDLQDLFKLIVMSNAFKSKCKGYKKETCWFSVNKSQLCSSCNRKKDEDYIIEVLRGNNPTMLTEILLDKRFEALIKKGDTFDIVIWKLYMIDKNYVRRFLESIQNKPIESNLLTRLYTHSDTHLCGVVGWMIRNDLYHSEILPCCMKCMASLIRYGTQKSIQDIIYSIHFDLRGPHHINIRSVICKNINKLSLLCDIAYAIIEMDGTSFIYNDYNTKVKSCMSENEYNAYIDKVNSHPLLHSQILTSGNKADLHGLYRRIKDRRFPYWEELIAKGMHPSRVIHWVMTEDQKECISGISNYEFVKGKAPWDIEWLLD